jgi:precorrin-6B methylase 2
VNWTELIENQKIKQLLAEHETQDPAKLALKWAGKTEIPATFLLTQIKARQKAKSKIPSWYNCKSIVYPDQTALEQCSSEVTAKIKAVGCDDLKVIDLTGGLGIDSWAFSTKAKSVLYVEPILERYELAQHNFKKLGITNVNFLNSTAENAVNQFADNEFDVVYLDPSRRDQHQRRAFRLADLQPNVLEMLPELLRIGKKILIKVGPMLDIHEAIKDFNGVEKIGIVSVKDECKELLFHIGQSNNSQNPKIECFEFQKTEPIKFSFLLDDEKNSELKIGAISNYIYDPYAAIIKAGAFKTLSNKFDVCALHANTHVYSSHNLIEDFPGKIYKIETILNYDLKQIKSSIMNDEATLIFRNFPVKSEDVIKKLKLKSSNNTYLFFVTMHDKSTAVILCSKVNLSE